MAPSQAAINTIVWTISLTLQALLVAAIFGRGIARTLPCFTTLVLFYPVRSALLFVLYGHPPDTYNSIYSSLSFLDLILQITVAAEIARQVIRSSNGPRTRRTLTLLLPLLAAAACTALTLALLPAHPPIPIDRAQTFLSYLLIFLFLWTLATSRSHLLRLVTGGLALYSIISLAAQAARINAALHRNASAYVAWSYATAATYLLVVLIWLLTLKQQTTETAVTAGE